jgi:hypothetical protein
LAIAGSGVIFLASAAILLSSGALAELVYRLGDVRDARFVRLTAGNSAHTALPTVDART